jgi:hypothetical protein
MPLLPSRSPAMAGCIAPARTPPPRGLVAIWVIDNAGDERGAILKSGTFQTTTRFSPTLTFAGSTFVVTEYIGMNGTTPPTTDRTG